MDEDWDDFYIRRPRMQLATGFAEEQESYSPSKLHISVFAALGVVFLASAIQTLGLLQSALVWLGLSFLIGPHVPVAYTWGDCRVGEGDELPDPEEAEEDSEADDADVKLSRRGARGARSDSNLNLTQNPSEEKSEGTHSKQNDSSASVSGVNENGKAAEPGSNPQWSNSEIERLKKGLLKFPRGTPRRWEHIAKYVDGKKAVEDVIAMSEQLAKKPDGKDDYATFLANRKTSAKATQGHENGANSFAGESDIPAPALPSPPASTWTEAEDLLLVKSLKEFPKETPLRWEKVSKCFPSKTKQECIKRFSDLKQNFKDSKNKTGESDLSGIE